MQFGHGDGASGASAFAADTGAGSLDVALTLAPPPHGAQTYAFEFTNDRAIESLLGYDFTRGATPTKFGAFSARVNDVAGFYASIQTSLWQGADVEWESQAGANPPDLVSATALRADFDLAPIGNKLSGCGYRKSMVEGVAVYSATTKMVIDCSGDLGDAVPFDTQIGIDVTRHIVLASNSLAAITSAIRGANDLHKNAAITRALAPLAGDPAVSVANGSSFCRSLSRSIAGRNASPKTVAAAKRADPADAPFSTFAFGTRFVAAGATARIVLQYADARTANKDVRARGRVLREGWSFISDEPYAHLLKLGEAVAKGRDVLLDVAGATAGRRLQLHDMWERGDLAFARC